MIADYLAMGGYAAYVWSSYALALIILGGCAFLSWRRARVTAARLETLRAAAPHRRRARKSAGEVDHGAQ